MKIKIDINLKVGRLVKHFVLADFMLISGWGLLAPVFAVFVIQKIPGANLGTVGVAVSIYWLVKSLIQLPIANFLDKTDGEKDDFYALIGGLVLAGIAAFGYLAVEHIWQLYFIQFLHAIAFGIYAPSWSAVFSRHLDKDRYSFDWSLDSSAIGIAAGISGFIGGFLAQWFGYNVIFILVGTLSIVSAFFIISVPEFKLPPPIRKTAVGPIDHKPPSVN